MSSLHFPWMETAIVLPLAGAILMHWVADRTFAHRCTMAVCGLTFLAALAEWADFSTLGSFQAHDHWDLIALVSHQETFHVDELSAPLLPLGALIYLVTVLSTRKKSPSRHSFSWMLLGESILLATFCCGPSWMLVGLLVAATIPPWIEMRRGGRCTRVYELHMGLFAGLLLVGWTWYQMAGRPGEAPLTAVSLMAAATLIRSGVAPIHCWMTDLFEKATFGTAILFVTPLTGAYAVLRLVLPVAPAWAMQGIAVISLFTAVYAGGMALVQKEARRFFCYYFLSNASLVLVGLELVTPIGLTGALCVWLSVGMALTGFGITLSSIEARIGRISLADFHGLHEQMPTLAGFFLLTGLASIGFPATVGFVGMELLVEGAVDVYPLIGTAVLLAAALNGISILQAWFRVFAGKRHASPVSLAIRPAERIAVLMVSVLILGGGLVPQPGVRSRHHAAVALGQQKSGAVVADQPGRELPDRDHSGE